MKKAERHAYIWRRADELAETGRFSRWIEIEFELRYREGYPEARSVLDDSFKRKWLTDLCKRHFKTLT